jgi:excisionase family DNA binding protein
LTARNDEPRWGVAEVASYLNVPVQTIYQWRKRKFGPPAVPLGRHLRYDPDDVRAWFRSQQQAAA